MLRTIAAILFILGLLALASVFTMDYFIHILVVVAFSVMLFNAAQKRWPI